MAPTITVVTGPPGAGKTTIAAALADRYEHSVHVEADWFWRWIRQGYIPPWLPESHDQNIVLIRIVASVAASYAAAGYHVIVDGIIGPWLLDQFLQALPGFTTRYIVLRPGLDVALARATARHAPELVDETPIRKMHAAFVDLRGYERFAIDTSQLDADRTVVALQKRLDAGHHDLSP